MEGDLDTSVLKDFANGRLPLESLAQIQSYLNDNPELLDRLEAIKDDSFVLALRETAQATDDSKPRTFPLYESTRFPNLDNRPPTIHGYQFVTQIKQHNLVSTWSAWLDTPSSKSTQSLRSQVIIKIFHDSEKIAIEDYERFQREADTLRKLSHPNIVRCLDFNSVPAYSYLTMEYVPGIDLSLLIASLGTLSSEAVAALAVQILKGLEYLSLQGVIHRDIKPSNVILGTDGIVRLIDFGLARPTQSTDKSLTRSEQFLGTVDYIAPEQALDPASADIRSDLYSLGCTLFKLLTGNAPFSGRNLNNPLKKVVAHAIAPPPKLKKLRPDLPEGLCDCIERLLAKNPDQRFQTPTDAITAFLPYGNVELATIINEAALKLINKRHRDLWQTNACEIASGERFAASLKSIKLTRLLADKRTYFFGIGTLLILLGSFVYLPYTSLAIYLKRNVASLSETSMTSRHSSENRNNKLSVSTTSQSRPEKAPLREGYYFSKEINLRNGVEQKAGIIISDEVFIYTTPDHWPAGHLRRFGCIWTRLTNHELESKGKFLYVEQPSVNGYLILEVISEDQFKATCWRGTGFSIAEALTDPSVGYFHSSIEGTWWSKDTVLIGPAPQLPKEIASDWITFVSQFAPRCVPHPKPATP